MDKAEYQSRLEELNSLVKKEDYEGALAVVEAVDWRRVKSLRTLGMVADVYEANKRYPPPWRERTRISLPPSERAFCTAW